MEMTVKPWSVDAPGNASSVISVGASTVSIPFPTFQVAGSSKTYQGLPLSKSDFPIGNDPLLYTLVMAIQVIMQNKM